MVMENEKDFYPKLFKTKDKVNQEAIEAITLVGGVLLAEVPVNLILSYAEATSTFTLETYTESNSIRKAIITITPNGLTYKVGEDDTAMGGTDSLDGDSIREALVKIAEPLLTDVIITPKVVAIEELHEKNHHERLLNQRKKLGDKFVIISLFEIISSIAKEPNAKYKLYQRINEGYTLEKFK